LKHSHSLRSWMAAVAAGCVLTLSLTACASSNNSSSNTSPSGTVSGNAAAAGTTASKPSGALIKIGVLVDLTGADSVIFKGSGSVATAWAKWVNAQGGINGHPVEVVVMDTQSSPATAAGDARELVENDDVAAVAVESLVAGPAIEPYLNSHNIPYLGNNVGDGPANPPSTYFSLDIGFPAYAETAALLAKSAGFKSLTSVVCSEIAACLSIGNTLKAYSPTVGVAYKGTSTMASTAPNATAQCVEIVNSGAGLTLAALSLVPTGKLITTCRAQGYKGGFAITSVSQANFLQLGATPLYGLDADFPWWSTAAAVVQYRDVMAQYAPGLDYRSYFDDDMWALLQLFSYAVSKSGPSTDAPVSGADVISAYRTAVKNVTLGGLLAQPITYSASGNTIVNCFWPVERRANGSFVTLTGSGPSGNGVTGDLASTCVS